MNDHGSRRALLPLVVATMLLFPAMPGARADHAAPGTPLWGYEASLAGARILQWDIGAHVPGPECVPDPSVNGRGIAFHPAGGGQLDGTLYRTHVTAQFEGDGLIHKSGPPPACESRGAIPFGDGPGGAIQDDVGALDFDPHGGNLWAAGYKPVGGLSFLYRVQRETGEILQACSVPFGGGGVGNDTLAVASLRGLGKVLLTDAGEIDTNQGGPHGQLLAVKAATCRDFAAGEIVASFPKVVGMTGIDFDTNDPVSKTNGELIAADLGQIYDLGDAPFATVNSTMSAAPSNQVEDITLRQREEGLG